MLQGLTYCAGMSKRTPQNLSQESNHDASIGCTVNNYRDHVYLPTGIWGALYALVTQQDRTPCYLYEANLEGLKGWIERS